jgi:hypothetical protein
VTSSAVGADQASGRRRILCLIDREEREVAPEAQELAEVREAAAYWEREAVLRTTTVASSLSAQILAGRRLAEVVEHALEMDAVTGEARVHLLAGLERFRSIDP